jgi:hypothetical protein
MSNQKDAVKRLEDKIDQILSQLATLTEEVQKLKRSYTKDAKTARRNDWVLFWRGGTLGIVSGLLSGLIISYQMKIYDYFQLTLLTWVLSFIVAAIFLALILLVMWKISKIPPKNPDQFS